MKLKLIVEMNDISLIVKFKYIIGKTLKHLLRMNE